MENWKAIPGYEGNYSVSDCGRVRGEARTVAHISAGKTLKPRILSARVNKATGYPTVNLSIANKRRTFTVHSLVALAFLGRRPDGHEVAHWDGDRENAALSNLRYTTPTGNREDARRHGTLAQGCALPQAKLTERAVVAIRSDRRLQKEIAAEHGVSVPTISQAKSRTNWAHVA